MAEFQLVVFLGISWELLVNYVQKEFVLKKVQARFFCEVSGFPEKVADPQLHRVARLV